ncbi:MAG: VanW family protein [Fimbriimonadaceae bacterium]
MSKEPKGLGKIQAPKPAAVCTAIALFGAAGVGIALAKQPPREVVIGGYMTSLQGRTDNQRHNAYLALLKLNGRVVKPGEVFSFNDTVGSWSRDKGYRRAPVSYNGTLVDAWGGGVCQASTTVYNASLLSGLEIVRRFPHVFAPSYCPPGRDAAVAFGGIDLKVRNPFSYPVKLKGVVQGDNLTVSWVADGRTTLPTRPTISSQVMNFERPGHVVVNHGETTNVARIRNGGKPGWEVITYRIWPERREFISQDTYPVMDRIIEFR